jgi:hypothetical protein
MKKTKPPFHQFQLHHRHPSIIQWYRMIKMKPDIHLYHQNHDQPPLSTIKKPYIYISSCNYILMNIHRVSNDIEWWYRWNQISIYGFRSLKKTPVTTTMVSDTKTLSSILHRPGAEDFHRWFVKSLIYNMQCIYIIILLYHIISYYIIYMFKKTSLNITKF